MSFNYGDVIDIKSNSGAVLSITNFKDGSSYSMGSSLKIEITKNGLEDLSNTLKVNPIYFNIGDKNIDITGESTPNSLVNVWIGDNYYSTYTNSDGDFALPITLTSDPTPETSVMVFSNNSGIYNTTLELNKENYKLQDESLTLQDYWGNNYNVVGIKFNQFTNEINTVTYGTPSGNYFSYLSSNAYTVTLYSSDGSVIKTESYIGTDTESDFIDDWNDQKFSYGDYIKIVSSSLSKYPIYYNNSLTNTSSKLSSTTAFYEITKNGLEEFNEPTVTVNNNTLSIDTYANSSVNIDINNKIYTYKINSTGKDTIKLPVSITSSTPIKVSVTTSSGISTYPITVYQRGVTTEKDYSFELHRDASINPNSALATCIGYKRRLFYSYIP